MSEISVDMRSHEGIRGYTAVWVMLFHCFVFSKFSIDLQGSSLMPLFFLLSGFSLTVVYGSRKSEKIKDIASVENSDEVLLEDVKKENNTLPPLNIAKFHMNRFARVFPMYYLCTLIALPLWFFGYGSNTPNTVFIATSFIISVIPVATLSCFLFGYGTVIDGPGWTVCTLAIFWIIFPYSFSKLETFKTNELVRRITALYIIQLLLVIISFLILLILFGAPLAFAVSTMQPLIRYPCFLMGVYAGEISRRCSNVNFFWPNSIFYGFFPIFTIQETDDDFWSNRVEYQFKFIIVLYLLIATIDGILRLGFGSPSILGGLWLQAIIPFSQLELIIGLTRDKGLSKPSQFFRTKLGAWLGKISMSLYLIHVPVLNYVLWSIYGSYGQWPDTFDCKSKYNSSNDDSKFNECEDNVRHFNVTHYLPVWAIPIVVVISVPLAWFIYTFVEEPCRKLIRIN
jgi:peptidoglycan/LPS O-acetylase OafA/YrhL